MGKPIAGRNKKPFGVGGILVTSAVLHDGTKLKNLYISKQRSHNVYDLCNDEGDIFQFLHITSVGKNKKQLNNDLSNDELSDLLSPGTFCIKIFHSGCVPGGYALKFMNNKIITNTGTIYTYYKCDKPITNKSISIVNRNADMIITRRVGVNDLPVGFDILFEPETYNPNIKIEISNEKIELVEQPYGNTPIPTFDIYGKEKGITKIRVYDVNNPSIFDEMDAEIKQYVTSVVFDDPFPRILEGETYLPKYEVLPHDADDKKLVWIKSSGDLYTNVDYNTGEVYGRYSGSSRIEAVALDTSQSRGSYKIEVYYILIPIENIKYDNTEYVGSSGDYLEIKPSLIPEDANNTYDLFYESDDPTVATMDYDGITFINPGECKITVYENILKKKVYTILNIKTK